MEKIRVCESHQDELIMPLIGTYVFHGAEYWCPYCGYTGGMMGAGERVEETTELTDRLEEYKEKSSEFRKAMAHRAASSFLYKGERITPSQLPEHEKEKDTTTINAWTYESD